MSSKKILRFPHVPQRPQPATVSLEQLIASVTAVWKFSPDRAQHLQQYLDTIPLPAKVARMDASSLPTVFASVDVENGELPVVSWPTYKRRVRAYIERMARRR